MLRLFVAVEIPSDLQSALANIQNEAKKDLKSARWVPPKNIHLTLKFLGNCPEEQLPSIEAALSKAVERKAPFTFRLNHLGGFPSDKRARVFWVGVGEGSGELSKLSGRLEKFLESLGFEREKRKFHSHATLARFKVPQNLQETISHSDITKLIASVEVKTIALIQSRLTPDGAVYAPIKYFPLKG